LTIIIKYGIIILLSEYTIIDKTLIIYKDQNHKNNIQTIDAIGVELKMKVVRLLQLFK